MDQCVKNFVIIIINYILYIKYSYVIYNYSIYYILCIINYMEYSFSERLRKLRKTDYGMNKDYTEILAGKNVFDIFVSLNIKTGVTGSTICKAQNHGANGHRDYGLQNSLHTIFCVLVMCRCFLSILCNVQVAPTNKYNFIILRVIIFESW
jgi:hypothetical protein